MGMRWSERRNRRRRRRVDLHKTLFVLPNLITLAAIFCGFNAIRICAKPEAGLEDFNRAAVLLIFAMLFDLLDGRVARMTRTQSAFGLQIDSLADVVSFGVAPALLMYQWVLHRDPFFGLMVAFLFVAGGAIRLARFNVLTSGDGGAPVKPGKYIVGLPTPAAAGILISLVVANTAAGGALGAPQYTWIMFAVTVGLSLLMVSNVKFRSFKDLKFNSATVFMVLFAIGSCVFIARVLKPQFVLVWLAGFYVVIGLIETLRVEAQRLRERRRQTRESLPRR